MAKTSSILREYWSGKSVLITGASSGLGWALTEALAPYGVTFGLLSRREEKMQELADSLKHTDSTFWIRGCDIRDREAVFAAVNDFHEHAGRIDVAWANSGISAPSSFKKWDWELIDACLKTNLYGTMHTVKACLNHMVPRKQGTIVGIGSMASVRGLPTRGVYSLTKISIQYLLESLSAELPFIQFTTIHPGFVDTPIIASNKNAFWVVPADRAADLMLHAVARKKAVYIFPFRMRMLYHIIRLLPQKLFTGGMRKFFRRAEKPELSETEKQAITSTN